MEALIKRKNLRIVTVFGLTFFLTSVMPAFSKDFLVRPPPKTMDKYYTDPGVQSEWITQMQKLSTAFSAIFVNIEIKKWDQAEKQAVLFRESYQKASKMVPEWEKDFNLKAATKLSKSVGVKDIKNIRVQSETIRETCSNCHINNSISAWIRYHWPPTKTIKLLDPLEEKEISYPIYMERLSNSLQRIGVNFEKNEFQQAWRSLEVFSKRLLGLRSACSKCHVSEWTKQSGSVKDFFVGEDIMDTLQKIKKDFATGQPSKKIFEKNIRYIHNRSCKICHLVHQPAAFIQRTWNQKK